MVRVLRMYEGWLGIDEDKFVGLDLEYTPEDPYEGNEVAVVQLAMRKHVLVYHLSQFVDLLSVANRFYGFLLLFFIHLLILQLLDFI